MEEEKHFQCDGVKCLNREIRGCGISIFGDTEGFQNLTALVLSNLI